MNKYSPEVIGLQETKVTDEDFPIEDINKLGYDATFIGQKTHYGVAIVSWQCVEYTKRICYRDESSQKRFISATLEMKDSPHIKRLFPSGENRKHPTKFPAKINFSDLDFHLQKNTLGKTIFRNRRHERSSSR